MVSLALLLGGPSQERGISLNSARSVADHLVGTDVQLKEVIYFDRRLRAYPISRSLLYCNTPSDFDFKLTLDGSAMTYYYETAPIPTAVGWFAHALPAGWHHFESWATLALELGVPFLVFLWRPFRLAAAAAFSVFQLLNIATANYGFFAYLALTLNILLLDDADVEALTAGDRVRISGVL